ncbi:MAG: 50S ribosomal protein L13 [bacterium]|nr:50S ribosomal protein L13 [bacterium]
MTGLLDLSKGFGYSLPFRSDREEGRIVPNPAKPTISARAEDIERRWLIVDANEQVLGRLATRVASVLRGKHRPDFTPHVDTGDHVIVVNASSVRLTGRKLEQKHYYRHSGYAGGIKSIRADRMLELHPERVIESAIKGMLPRGPLGRQMFRKLKVYAGAEHPHAAQKPETMELT